MSPNPLVGAALVRKGRIISRGWHARYGGDHAEVDCLNKFKGDPKGATMYVSLEPCVHWGKTPPCVERLIDDRIGEVVLAMRDPNPQVAGKGIRKLRKAGIRVRTGVLAAEASFVNRFFITSVVSGLPYISVKIAQSIDGFIGGQGAPRWISSLESRRLVHTWRSQFDAVLVGVGTVAIDNPSLTVRLVRGRHPDVIVVDGRATLSATSKLVRELHGRRVFLAFESKAYGRRKAKIDRLESRGVIPVPIRGRNGRFQLFDLLREVHRHMISSVLVEGGAGIFTAFRESGLANDEQIFLAPFRLGGGIPANLHHPSRPDERNHVTMVRAVGRDTLFSVYYPSQGYVHRDR